MISQISFKVQTNKFNQNKNGRLQSTLERTPKKDCVSFSGIKGVKIAQDLKNALDTRVFKFRKNNGQIFEGTIKEYLKSCNIRNDDIKYLKQTGIMHNTYFEQAKAILEHGLDWTKTSRVQCGPGTYFIPCQDFNYGPVAIEGFYQGNMKKLPIFEKNFYEAIRDNREVHGIISKYGVSDTNKTLNQYCHDVLADEMGIDVLYSPNRESACYVVLKDDSLKLHPYNFKIVDGKIKRN